MPFDEFINGVPLSPLRSVDIKLFKIADFAGSKSSNRRTAFGFADGVYANVWGNIDRGPSLAATRSSARK
jgi:hypothetical protein